MEYWFGCALKLAAPFETRTDKSWGAVSEVAVTEMTSGIPSSFMSARAGPCKLKVPSFTTAVFLMKVAVWALTSMAPAKAKQHRQRSIGALRRDLCVSVRAG